MIDEIITSIDQITPDWLTSALARSGALTRGAVSAIEIGTDNGNWSSNARLSVRYTPNSSGRLPRRLFLKMVDTDLGDGEFFGDSEVTYYTRDYVNLKNTPLLRCYDAGYSPELNRYHILLDDVTETHINADEVEPTLDYGLALAEGLAVLHAHWWGEQRLAEAGAPLHSANHIQNFVDIAAAGVEPILGRYADELKPHWPGAIHELFTHHPQAMIQRSHDLNGFTLIHGDVGCQNVLVSRQGVRPVYIIDRQPFNWSLTTWLGVYDLAYAIVLDWDVEMRRRCEIPMLKRYHESLIQNGVLDYSWQQLYDDYRLSAAMGVYIATEYCRGGVNSRWVSVWLLMLQRALTACDDLECSLLWREYSSG